MNGRPNEVDPMFREKRFFLDGRTGVVARGLAALGRRFELSPSRAALFAHVGWVPGVHTLFEDVICLPAEATLHKREDVERWTETEVAEQASRLFDEATLKLLSADSRAPIVPLSGGLDSRAVLGAVLRHCSPREVTTVTFGLPGTLDFEIGTAVARRAGTRHVALDLTHRHPTIDRLMRTAEISDANTDLLSPCVWTFIEEVVDTESAKFWTGFTGDGIGGSHAMPPIGTTESGRSKMGNKRRRLSIYDDHEGFPNQPEIYTDGHKLAHLIGPEEAVWFENHVERYTTHQLFMNHLEYANPFMDKAVVELFLSLPFRLRKRKLALNHWIFQDFAHLFDKIPCVDYGFSRGPIRSLSASTVAPHLRWKTSVLARKLLSRALQGVTPHPKTTYWNFATDLRKGGRLDAMATELIESLAARRILEPRLIRRAHQLHRSDQTNNPLRVTLLMSLEMIARRFATHQHAGPS